MQQCVPCIHEGTWHSRIANSRPSLVPLLPDELLQVGSSFSPVLPRMVAVGVSRPLVDNTSGVRGSLRSPLCCLTEVESSIKPRGTARQTSPLHSWHGDQIVTLKMCLFLDKTSNWTIVGLLALCRLYDFESS